MTRRFAAAAAAVLLAAAPALAQSAPAAASQQPVTPFGLRMGMMLSELAAYHPEARRTPGVYILESAPSPQPEFRDYMVVLSPRLGLCKVMAMGRTIDSSENGEEVRSAFGRLQELLVQKYGKGDQVDDLKEGSLWTEPSEWLRSVRERERIYETVWNQGTGTMPSNLSAIALDANSTDAASGFLTLAYEFSNFADCRQELNSQRSDSF